MVQVTKEEKEAILEKYPDVAFVRTARQRSKRHHYYMEEQPKPVKMLRALRGQERGKGRG